MVLVENGVVGLDDNGEIILGHFSKNKFHYDVFLFTKGIKYIIMDVDILKNSKLYKECLSDGNFYKRTEIDTISLYLPQTCSPEYKNSLDYDSRKSLSEYSKRYHNLYNNKISKNIEKYGDFIKDFTFGIEFETTSGFVPPRLTDKLGLMPLRDGSIPGLEYATIPLGGKKGLQTVVDICDELKKRTTFDDTCALHVHMGGIPRTEEFFLALFKVLVAIEDEFYSMFPIYMKYNYGVKRKHYTKKFPINETIMCMDPIINNENIKRNFGVLFKFLSSNQFYKNYKEDLNNVEYHPSDPNGESKWNIKSRYYWCNLIPLLFGNKKTVEFRVHTPTLDSNKIINYLVILSSILDYSMKYTNNILSSPLILSGLNIRDIIVESNPNASTLFIDNIFEYMQQRKDYIYRVTKKGDIIADENKFKNYNVMKWSSGNNSNLHTFKRRERFTFEPAIAHPVISNEELQDALDAVTNNTF